MPIYVNYTEWLFDKTTTDMTEQELHEILAVDGNYHIELTTSTGDIDKFLEELASSLTRKLNR